MPSPRLIAIVTTYLLFAASGAQAAFTLEQLRDVERLILSRDCGALFGYLSENPALMQGDDPLALELRNFSSGVQGGLIECLSVGPGNTGQIEDFSSTLTPLY